MTKKELEKRIKKCRSFWMDRNHIENYESDYLKKIYELWEENNKKGEIEMKKINVKNVIKELEKKVQELNNELKHMNDVELEDAIASGDGDYFEEISGYISELTIDIKLINEKIKRLKEGEINEK